MCSTFSPLRHSNSPPHTLHYSAPLLSMTIYVYLVVLATPTYQPQQPTNLLPAPHFAPSLAILPTTKDTAVLISKQIVSFYLVTSCLTSTLFPLLSSPPHLRILIFSLIMLTLYPSLLVHFFLQDLPLVLKGTTVPPCYGRSA